MKNKFFTLIILVSSLQSSLFAVRGAKRSNFGNSSQVIQNININTNEQDQSGGVSGGFSSVFSIEKVIMNTLLNDPLFKAERKTIKSFLKSSQINNDYRVLVDAINNSTPGDNNAIKSIHAIERAIMHCLKTQNYIVSFESKWANIAALGIKWSWVNPKAWINPMSWFTENDPMVKLCMNELDRLAKVSENHSVITSLRLKAKVDSYLNWKKNIMIAISVYLAANLLSRGWKESSVKAIKNDGLSSTIDVVKQVRRDVIDFYTNGTSALYKTSKKISDFIKPVVGTIVYGDNYKIDKNNSLIVQ